MKKVLFICNLNAVRSPMAAALLRARAGDRVAVDSAGLHENDYADPFVAAVLGEIGVPFGPHEPKTIDLLDLSDFDLVVALTPSAYDAAQRRAPAGNVELWKTDNPSDAFGGREQAVEAYRAARDQLRARIDERFPASFKKP